MLLQAKVQKSPGDCREVSEALIGHKQTMPYPEAHIKVGQKCLSLDTQSLE